MEIIFISDLHSNLEAINSISKEIRNKRIYCLGDIVGYGPNPNESIDWVRDNTIKTIKGNHDYAVVNNNTSNFNLFAKKSILWTIKKLTIDNTEYLKNLPLTYKFSIGKINILLVHGSPENPLNEYVIPEHYEQLFEYYLIKNKVNIIVLGHTHIPFSIKKKNGYIINPGSVGQPRNGNPNASYAIVNIEDNYIDVKIKNVKYNWDKTINKMNKINFKSFSSRLKHGY